MCYYPRDLAVIFIGNPVQPVHHYLANVVQIGFLERIYLPLFNGLPLTLGVRFRDREFSGNHEPQRNICLERRGIALFSERLGNEVLILFGLGRSVCHNLIPQPSESRPLLAHRGPDNYEFDIHRSIGALPSGLNTDI